jgi:hypothetical protein
MIRRINFSAALTNQDPKAAGKADTEMKTEDVCFMRINVEGRRHVPVPDINNLHKVELIRQAPAECADAQIRIHINRAGVSSDDHKMTLMIMVMMMTTEMFSLYPNDYFLITYQIF